MVANLRSTVLVCKMTVKNMQANYYFEEICVQYKDKLWWWIKSCDNTDERKDSHQNNRKCLTTYAFLFLSFWLFARGLALALFFRAWMASAAMKNESLSKKFTRASDKIVNWPNNLVILTFSRNFWAHRRFATFDGIYACVKLPWRMLGNNFRKCKRTK